MMTSGAVAPTPVPPGRRGSPWRIVLGAVVLAFAAFWVWALFFASKEAINKIGDRAWAARAETICAEAEFEREALADFRRVDNDDPAMVAERGDLVDAATDVVVRMLDRVVEVAPADAKGQALVPQWEQDYRTYLEDRRRYADVLRSGRNAAFTETAADRIPISDKVATFAGDNDMPSCSPPIDL
ncbi:MAG: hypothetical protein ACR2HP_16965 [Ilumatobacteraceae bacterium]